MLPCWFTLYQEQYKLGSWHSIHLCHTCWPCSRRHRLQIQNGSADGTTVGLFFIYFLSIRSVMLLPLGSPLNCSSSIRITVPLEMDLSPTIFMSEAGDGKKNQSVHVEILLPAVFSLAFGLGYLGDLTSWIYLGSGTFQVNSQEMWQQKKCCFFFVLLFFCFLATA